MNYTEDSNYQKLKKENKRLKRANIVLMAFAILVIIIQLYNIFF